MKTNIRVAIRTDASLQIGTGHVMRCLTLAEALRKKGAQVEFICRRHKGHLTDRILSQGFNVHVLEVTENSMKPASLGNLEDENTLPHTKWLATSQTQDADECRPLFGAISPDWLIVDHYAIDRAWETALKGTYKKLMVIDDLADRNHDCELLLDQTFRRNANCYRLRVPRHCCILTGSNYALLRPEFAELRNYSLGRRKNPELQRLLIAMGGVDIDNATGRILDALEQCTLPDDCIITVVMGSTAPWLESVREQAKKLPWTIFVEVAVSNMAQLIADCDLAIGAAGSTSWERCCLGVPTIMLVTAENQMAGAESLYEAQAVSLLTEVELEEELSRQLYLFSHSTILMHRMAVAAAAVTDGKGVKEVTGKMWELL